MPIEINKVETPVNFDPTTNVPTLITVPHSGTRWMMDNFIMSDLPIRRFHFGEYMINYENRNFTLLRDPRKIILSHLKRGFKSHQLRDLMSHSLKAQKEFIDNGGKFFYVEHAVEELNDWLDLNGMLKDHKNLHSINEEVTRTTKPVYSSGNKVNLNAHLDGKALDWLHHIFNEYKYYEWYM